MIHKSLKKMKKGSSALDNIMKDPLGKRLKDGAMSVTVSADDQEGLKKGLKMAEEIAGGEMKIPSLGLDDIFKKDKKKKRKEDIA